MGITKPTEEHFDKGLWGRDGSQWRKLGLLWGFWDTYSEVVHDVNVSAGDAVLDFGAVPAGEVWVVQHFAFVSYQANASRLELGALVGGLVVWVEVSAPVVAYQSVSAHHDIVLEVDDYIRAIARDAVEGDDFHAYACGYKMKVT